eukprot:7353748-Prymnesium_polylepis.2
MDPRSRGSSCARASTSRSQPRLHRHKVLGRRARVAPRGSDRIASRAIVIAEIGDCGVRLYKSRKAS